MRIIIFGIGKFYQNRKKELHRLNDNIVAFIDNKFTGCGNFEDKKAYNPEYCQYLDYDKVILMSAKHDEMSRQLESMGVEKNQIFTWEEYRCYKLRGEINLYINSVECSKAKKVLIVSTDLNYNGGSLAAIYAVKALKELRYDVWLAVPAADKALLSETRKMGINIAVVSGMPYIADEELFWIRNFDVVIVNVFQMVECAYLINHIRPVMWWIHEPVYDYDHYKETLKKFPKYRTMNNLSEIYTVAVSEVPKNNFNSYFQNVIKEIMPYGIPDEYERGMIEKCEGNVVFSIIGGISKRKAQKIFVEAAVEICKKYKEAEFWLIGGLGNNSYSEEIKNYVKPYDKIKLCGLMTRKDIRKAFRDIDAVVCTSIEDPLPIVVTEGMMYGKVCIVSDAVGQASMIENGENGFVTKVEDVDELYRTMEWVILHRDELGSIKKKSRELYEKYFTMEKFGERLESGLLQAEKLFYEREGNDR